MQGRAAKGYAVFLRSWFAYAYVDRVRATCRHSAAQVRFQVGTYETGGYAMHTNEIRAKFQQSIGLEKYRKFVLALNALQAKRLAFWQEELWEPFRKQHELSARSFEEVRTLFRYCHIHDTELVEDAVPIVYGTPMPQSQPERDRVQALHPYSRTFIQGPCWVEEARIADVYFCPECRRAAPESS